MTVGEVRVRPAIYGDRQRRTRWITMDLLFVRIRLVVEDEEQGVELHLGHLLGQMLINHGRMRFLRIVVWRGIRVLRAVIVGPRKGSAMSCHRIVPTCRDASRAPGAVANPTSSAAVSPSISANRAGAVKRQRNSLRNIHDLQFFLTSSNRVIKSDSAFGVCVVAGGCAAGKPTGCADVSVVPFCCTCICCCCLLCCICDATL